jgi:hypothetical protein
MKGATGSFATLIFLLTSGPLMFSQGKPSPALPSDVLGPQLIAWSQVQKPQPVTEPHPPPDQPVQQSERQPGQPDNTPSQEGPRQVAAQNLAGTILKDGSRYILKVSNSSTYQLDDQDRAKQYEGKQVKVAGTLDANGDSFHVISIELIS